MPFQQSGQLALDRAFFVRVARGLVRDATDADDLVQDAFVIAIRNGRVNGKADRAYVRGVLRNLALRSWRDRRRRRRRETHAASSDQLPDSTLSVTRAETSRSLAADIETLPDVYRIPLVLRYFEQLTPQEIALRLDVTPSTVRTRLQRARQRLRTRIDRRYGGGREALGAALLPLALDPAFLSATEAAGGAASVLGAVTGQAGTSTRIVRIAAAVLLGVAAGSMVASGSPLPFAAGAAPNAALHAAGSSLTATEDTGPHGVDATADRADATRNGAPAGALPGTSPGAALADASGSGVVRSAPAAPRRILRGSVQGLSAGRSPTVHVAAFRIGAAGPEDTASATTTAEADGTFELRVALDETWLVVAAARGSAPGAITVSPSAAARPVRVALAPGLTLSGAFEGGRVHGAGTAGLVARVRSAEPSGHALRLGDGLPELRWANGGVHWGEVSVAAEAGGRVRVPGLTAGRFVVDLVAPGAATADTPRIVQSVELTVSEPTPADRIAPAVPTLERQVADAEEAGPPLRDVMGRDVTAQRDEATAREASGDAPPTAYEGSRTHSTPPARIADDFDIWPRERIAPVSPDPRRVDADGAAARDAETGPDGTFEIDVTPVAPMVPPVAVIPEPVNPTPSVPSVPVVPVPDPEPLQPPVPVIPEDGAAPGPDPGLIDPYSLLPYPELHARLVQSGAARLELMPAHPNVVPDTYHIAQVVHGSQLKSDGAPELELLPVGELFVIAGQAHIVVPAGTYCCWSDAEVAADPDHVSWVEVFPGDVVVVAVGRPPAPEVPAVPVSEED